LHPGGLNLSKKKKKIRAVDKKESHRRVHKLKEEKMQNAPTTAVPKGLPVKRGRKNRKKKGKSSDGRGTGLLSREGQKPYSLLRWKKRRMHVQSPAPPRGGSRIRQFPKKNRAVAGQGEKDGRSSDSKGTWRFFKSSSSQRDRKKLRGHLRSGKKRS